jgi:hypothetical protein
LKLLRLPELLVLNSKAPKRISGPVTSPVIVAPEPDLVELEERKAMATDGVPELYLDAWGRLQCQKPIWVSDADWRQAIDAAGRFLDQWGSLAVEFQWTPADLFDVPRDGRSGGLVWFLQDETVRALGPEYAVTEGERIFDWVTRLD